MRYWLVKQEPTDYPYSSFVRDGTTSWSGVHHPTAQRNLREMRPKDRGIYYHTGTERAAVGTFRVIGAPHPDSQDDRGAWTVEIQAERALDSPVPLAALRTDRAFSKSPLLKEPRLSIAPLSATEWTRFLTLGARPPSRSVSR
ncbi:MAG: EVE domain-containing protein [Thermoplasmata archaeon]|nr:EVE domain-containing protein [Thermoplasmata archaeon]